MTVRTDHRHEGKAIDVGRGFGLDNSIPAIVGALAPDPEGFHQRTELAAGFGQMILEQFRVGLGSGARRAGSCRLPRTCLARASAL